MASKRNHQPNPCKVFVGNISYRVTFQELSEFFSQFGPVEYSQIVKDHKKLWSRGIGFVTFKNAESAQLALGASDDVLCLDERILRVSTPKKPKRRLVVDEVEDVKTSGEDSGVSVEGGCSVGGCSVGGGSAAGGSSREPGQDNKSVVLNSDTLIHIFSYLSLRDRIVVERVCKSWLMAARLLWKTVKSLHFRGIFKAFTGKYESLSDDILHSVLKRGCHGLQELSLSASPRKLSDFALDVIGMYCPKLEVLDISGVSLTTTSFNLLTQRCNGLTWLKLAGCHQVGEKGLWWALHNCQSLESLDITGNRRITGQCFYLAGFPSSTEGHTEVKGLPSTTKIKDLTTTPKIKGHLKRLILEACSSIKDEGICLLSQHNVPVLEVVNINQCQLLTGVAIRSLASIRRMPEVAYIEEETMAHGDEIPWHLDRIDQQTSTFDSRYNPPTDGRGVDIYILDSGIRYDHAEFEYDAKYAGYDPTDAFERTSRLGSDCHGHGTHVSSLAGGRTFGVAKGAQIYAVRVLDCTNAGPWSVVLDGLDFVARVIGERKRPAVVSMSLGGGYTRSVNDAIQRMYNQGIHVVVAAGNGFQDACGRSPASSPYATTVGGSARGDDIYFSTNFGRCVDIFAPGSVIEGADHTCTTCTKTISGTSMSTPMVSGVVAILLSREPLLTPIELRRRLVDLSVKNRLNFGSIPFQDRGLTANRLLHIPGDCGGLYSASSLGANIRSPVNRPSNPGLYPPHAHCTWTITAQSTQTVQLDFTSLAIEFGYDVIRVCEGYTCRPGTVIGTPSDGFTTQRRYFSIGEVLTIEMITDGLIEFAGFRATYRSTGVAGTPAPPPAVTTPTSFTPPPSTAPPPTTTPPPTTMPLTTTATPTTATTTVVMTTTPANSTEPTAIIDTCTTDNSQVPVLLTELLQEASTIIQQAVAASLAGFLEQRVLGLLPDYPAENCRQVAQFRAATTRKLTSGMYWVRTSNGSAVQMYCDLETPQCACRNPTPGWMRVADIDMRDTNQNCPPGLKLWDNPLRSCGRLSRNPGCSSTFLSTNGIPYSRVCGKIIGYQYSSPNAFYAHQYDPEVTLEQYYVDGVSLTYGLSPRQHIWTFAAARSEVDVSGHICPCINSANTLPDTAIPEFIKNDYFCDTGSSEGYENDRFYSDNPLWDGKGCGPANSCCDKLGTGYFCRDLGAVTNQDIELRICANENTDNEDVPIEIVNVYVQ